MEIFDLIDKLPKHPLKKYKTRPLSDIKYIAIHHSGTTEGDAYSFSRYHVFQKDWPGIGYHYVILKDGAIQWTNDLRTMSYHVGDYNTYAVGVCLVGDFTWEEPTKEQLNSAIKLTKCLLAKFPKAAVLGHNEFEQYKGNTECPGIDMNEFRKQVVINEDLEYLVNKSIINSPEYWHQRLNEPMPVWAVFAIMRRILKKLEEE